jgi:D-sedoheptulose 7-phosphate isomerase
MNDDKRIQYIIRTADESADLRRTVGQSLAKQIVELADTISGVIGSGGKILICGNGGSAADSSHMAAEMIVRLTKPPNGRGDRPSLPAIALSADTAIMTATANDFGFDKIFARQIQGLGKKGDILLLISTSGNSANLLKAAEIAREIGILTAALLGGDGGKLVGIVDKPIIVPHNSVQRIQEEQIFLIHLLVELVESGFFG